MTENSAPQDVSQMSFEEALSELEKIVSGLEQGNVALDKSIEYYERGEALRNHCQKLLRTAEDKVEKIRTGPEGKAVGSEQLDPE